MSDHDYMKLQETHMIAVKRFGDMAKSPEVRAVWRRLLESTCQCKELLLDEAEPSDDSQLSRN